MICLEIADTVGCYRAPRLLHKTLHHIPKHSCNRMARWVGDKIISIHNYHTDTDTDIYNTDTLILVVSSL